MEELVFANASNRLERKGRTGEKRLATRHITLRADGVGVWPDRSKSELTEVVPAPSVQDESHKKASIRAYWSGPRTERRKKEKGRATLEMTIRWKGNVHIAIVEK